jgi:hypothetical protein
MIAFVQMMHLTNALTEKVEPRNDPSIRRFVGFFCLMKISKGHQTAIEDLTMSSRMETS